MGTERKLVKNARIVNEGDIFPGSVLIEGKWIAQIIKEPEPGLSPNEFEWIIDAENSYLLPGVIDDQVHFREPGLTEKGDILSESRAAVAGGITSFMEMPNTQPQTTTVELLAEKFLLGAQNSMANYSFYMGATNDNLDEILKNDIRKICGVKVFMGSSTGNMLVDDPDTLDKLFAHCPTLIATHCEDENTIRANMEQYTSELGDKILPSHHPYIRNHLACLLSSQKATSLAKKHNTRLHILHISTAVETALFETNVPLSEKRITAEACVHHLWFNSSHYQEKGNLIKWNPAIKNQADQQAIWSSLLKGGIDVVATDHAPHLYEDKLKPYLQSPSGGPLVQHSLQAMYDSVVKQDMPVHYLSKWMAHNPANCFKVSNRGFIRTGYAADLVILNPRKPYTVNKDNILYKCGWSPFEGHTFLSTPTHTIINGRIVHENGAFDQNYRGESLTFDR